MTKSRNTDKTEGEPVTGESTETAPRGFAGLRADEGDSRPEGDAAPGPLPEGVPTENRKPSAAEPEASGGDLSVTAVVAVPFEADEDSDEPTAEDRDSPPDNSRLSRRDRPDVESPKVWIIDEAKAAAGKADRLALANIGATGGTIDPLTGRLFTNGGNPIPPVPFEGAVTTGTLAERVAAANAAAEAANA